MFRFEFLPEGDYVVRVGDAREATQELEKNESGGRGFSSLSIPSYKETVVQRYGKFEGALKVQTDMTGVVFAVGAEERR